MKAWPSAILLASLLSVPLRSGGTPPAGETDRQGNPVKASADVTFVEVPIYVSDRDGRPLRGLRKGDFQVTDDGKPVRDFDLEVVDLEDFSAKAPTPSAMPLPPAAQRHFFFLFDLTFAQPINVARARHAAIGFVENDMKNGDLGAVATVDVEKGLKLVLSFTSDRDQLVAALTGLSLPTALSPMSDPLALTIFDPSTSPGGAPPGSQTASRSMNDAEWADTLASFKQMNEKSFDSYAQGRVVGLTHSLSDLARTLNSVHGRKNVIYFSEGFDSKLMSGVAGMDSGRSELDQIASGESWRIDSESRYGRSDVRLSLEEMFKIFRRTDCVLYTLDVAGLSTMGVNADGVSATDRLQLGSRGRGRESLFTMASETGGQLFENSNALGEQLTKLQEQMALVYLLTFSPAELKNPGQYHALKVKVKASGAQVSFRPGYFEPRPWSKLTPMERRLQTASQITYGLPRNDIPARALVAPLLAGGGVNARVPVILEIPGETLVRQAVGNTLNLEIFAYASDQAMKTKGFLTQSVALDLSRVGPQLTRTGIRFYGEILLPPGVFWLKVLLRIAETGRTGIVIVPVTVPPKESRQLFVVGPLFHEVPAGGWLMVKAPPRTAGAAPPAYPFLSKGEPFIPAAAPVLDGAGTAVVSLFVYNAPAEADLELRGEIRERTGLPVGAAELTKPSITRAAGEIPSTLLCTFRTEKLKKGSYALWVEVKDRLSPAVGETLGFFEVR